MVYRFYVQMQDATDRMSAVFGNDQASLIIDTPSGAFNSPYNSSWNASGINPAFLPVFPDLADDTYATIGLTGPASTSGIAGAADPSIVEDANQPVTPYFLTPGATNLTSTTLTGASWYILNTAGNGLPNSNLRVLIAQVTTAGSISGQMNYQVFPLGVGADQQRSALSLMVLARLVLVAAATLAVVRTLLRPTTTLQHSTTMALVFTRFLDVLTLQHATTMPQQPWTMALACKMTSVAFAVVMASQLAIATVTATSSTPWACVVVIARLTLTPMASVMTLTTA